ncbi:helix-turn-helix domain-containing protein [Amycolatopsis carbonis]|uniref:Helix-turn-helix domain-containing protein n=1 Tax=Amycolatopsis carbonis TaxID=715471 RepID=A0A9Y2ICE6_9PSEU|nr:helix-turn-helix domain-containing protein [Amycolatopsis sp. 2-15]WIX76530.1 helix-turn-helix domain-containing protein [Amycolatopsis sp. 2-15]
MTRGDGLEPRGDTTPRLRASWQRSARYGVPDDEVKPVFTATVDTGSLLFECGDEVLRGLHATLADEPISLMLTDSEGLVLSRLCGDPGMTRSLDRVHLAPGFSYAESNAGTNGLALALADRTPSLVRAGEHYCTSLRGYTCAAVPVLDPITGALAGSVNLTTWSEQSSGLLLALAQTAAGHTTSLMLARASGRRPRPAPRGEVFRVYADRIDPPELSAAWQHALLEAMDTMGRGRTVAVVGEPGAGKTALAALARRELHPRERVLNARPPAPDDVDAWLAMWSPEVGKADTCVIVSGVDALPAWAAGELAARFTGHPTGFVLTASDSAAIPKPLMSFVDTVVELPPLRLRPDDILPLAHHFAHRARGRAVSFTPAAARALATHDWPENAKQLRRVVAEAAARADTVDTHHLPPEVFTTTGHRLSRLQAMERDEIVRCLAQPGATVVRAAAELGMGRATIYRKMAQYGIKNRQLRS